jgi:hypothetical protein
MTAARNERRSQTLRRTSQAKGISRMSSFTAIVSILAAAAAVTFAITAYVN